MSCAVVLMGEQRGQCPGVGWLKSSTSQADISLLSSAPASHAGRHLCALICAKLRKQAVEHTNTKTRWEQLNKLLAEEEGLVYLFFNGLNQF